MNLRVNPLINSQLWFQVCIMFKRVFVYKSIVSLLYVFVMQYAVCSFISLSPTLFPNLLSSFFTSDIHQPLSQIRISLASSLGAGQVIFLAGINATENTVTSLRSHPF